MIVIVCSLQLENNVQLPSGKLEHSLSFPMIDASVMEAYYLPISKIISNIQR